MAKIVFKINGKPYEADGKFSPDVSLNDYIRTVAELRGTKAMCHEGGCGACIVAVRAALPPTNEVKLFSVNSCLVSVLSCHGWDVTTVEGIGSKMTNYHDIQSRLANFNGTQCGYCTPGWVMNMYSFYEAKGKSLTMKDVENSFASNICRCTGYRPIADAFKTFANNVDKDLMNKLIDLEDLADVKCCHKKCSRNCLHKNKNEDRKELSDSFKACELKTDEDWCVIENSDNKMIVVDCGITKWYKTYTLDDVFKVICKNSEYKLIAGNTGQGVYHVADYPSTLIDIFNVVELRTHTIDVNLIIGAGMPLADMMELFLVTSQTNEDFGYLKVLYDHMDLVAHMPVRNIGTIGGNLFLKYLNNEFQSDLFLLFETVGAMITIAEGVSAMKVMSFTDFLKTDMKRKLIVNVMLPPLSSNIKLKTYKIMPRSQNAHAIVNAGFLFKFKANSKLLEQANVVYGSISPKFNHATKTEAILAGKDPFTNETLQLALKSLSAEITPEEAPPEPSAAFRKMLAIALYYKAILSLCPDDIVDPKLKSGGEAIKRHTSRGTQIFDTDKSIWPLNQPIPKLEGLVQCSGEAIFANDLPTQPNEVFAAFVTADVTPGSVIGDFDTTEAFKLEGVIAFYTAKDIPGLNSFAATSCILIDVNEEILCSSQIKFYGDPVGIIVADREKTANKAAKLVKITYKSISNNKPLLKIEDVLISPDKNKRVVNNRTVHPKEVGNDVKYVINGEYKMESQHHFYMEPQTCIVRPTEDGLEVISSTQWLDLTNAAIAQCLNMPTNSIQVLVRRVGGAYGGKITRSCQIACAAALVTHHLGKTCRFILPLQNNMSIVGKRLPTTSSYEVGVNQEGVIQYLKNVIYQDNGCSANETIAPITVTHFFNCYDPRRWYVEANSVTTDTPSNTWCRAPSSTEGVAMIENIMEKIAHVTGKDSLHVRSVNMTTEDNPLPDLIEHLKKDSDYDERLKEVKEFNNKNRWRKRALKLMPMNYELFYIGPYNSLVSIYHADGSVAITHGGIEMGQGINTKVAQVCAYTLGIPLEKISVKPSSSFTSPNAMATGASVGSECVSFATMKACEIILERLAPVREKMDNPSWDDLIQKAYTLGVDLQACYMYSSKDDVKSYDVYGVCALEVEVDILTGNHDIRRVDLLEDTGRSLSPKIDVAQIEGAFVMGLGYWTSEKVVYDPESGKLLTDRTWTYKPPGIKDIPADFRVYFRRNYNNPFGVLKSKASGEPALCLASVLTHALREAVRAARLEAGYDDQWFDLLNPCTVENIFMAVDHKLEHFILNSNEFQDDTHSSEPPLKCDECCISHSPTGALSVHVNQKLDCSNIFCVGLLVYCVDRPEDTVEHTVEVCPAWVEHHRVLVAAIGGDLSHPTLVQAMARSESACDGVHEDRCLLDQGYGFFKNRNCGADPKGKRTLNMMMPKELKYSAIAGGVAVFGLIFGWVLFPVILKSQLKKEMALSKKTDVRKMWEQIPFALNFKVYLFNYTNAEEVAKGAKPILKEIGPYHFDEWKEKVEIEDHEEDDTITYKRRDTFYFNPELSAPGLTGEEIVVMPHIFMMGMALTINRDKPAMLNMIGKALNGIFDNPTDIFMRVKALDILFRGIIFNCARTEFAPKATCTALKKEAVNGLVLEANNQFRFSLFGTRNNTIDPHVITVKRGIKNVMDVGQVVAVDGKLEQTIWKDSCNEYQGTDGTVFPPFLQETDRLQSFSTDLCRSFKPWYQKKTSYRGIKTNRYIANIGNFAEDPELQCFCPEPGQCPPKGLMDLAPCIKAPMYASMPHFLDCDPALLNNVKGLNPDSNQHGIEIDFEPISGTPMVAKQRIQFNLQLLKTDKIDIFKDLSGDIVPIFWIDEGLALNKTFVNMLKHQLFIPKRVVGVLRWWMVSFGSLGAVIGIVYHFKDHIMRLAVSGDTKVTKVTPEEETEQKDISVIGPVQDTSKNNI